MPINLGSNLKINNNKISATQEDLFKKLNVAYGWTHTQTTSSGGTAVVLINDGDILTTIECNDINKCYCGNFLYSSNNANTAYIADGKLYVGNSQKGSKTDYISVSGNGAFNSMSNIVYCLDSSGKIWQINTSNQTETQIGTESGFEHIYPSNTYGSDCGVIKDGKIYLVYYTNAPVQKCSSLSNISKFFGGSNTSGVYGFSITTDGKLYRLSNDTATLVGTDSNWKNIYNGTITSTVPITNNNDDLYFAYNTTLYKQNISNVKKAASYESSYIIAITTDNELYYGYSIANKNGENYGYYKQISNNMKWKDISWFYGTRFYAISEEGKLYKINITSPSSSSSTFTYTQIGTESNYQKVDGYNGNSSSYTAIAWTGDATTVSHTILTTKSPQANDAAYIDKDLTQYSTVQSTSSTTVTDQYRTYDRDTSKDTLFTAIPPATVHETVSTIDFLRITKPDN